MLAEASGDPDRLHRALEDTDGVRDVSVKPLPGREGGLQLPEYAVFSGDTVRRDAPKVGRNEPCPCGSGKKFKKCHGAQMQ